VIGSSTYFPIRYSPINLPLNAIQYWQRGQIYYK
jgi:hypothetical protein